MQTVAEQDATYGKDLFARDPDLCCALRKVEPLERGAGRRTTRGPPGCAATSRRPGRSPRSSAGTTRSGKVKVSPLARWTDDDVDRYIAEHDVLVNPLQYDGYPSIGCSPCTRRVAPGEDPRSGRWAGTGKTECGIHQ